MDVIGVDCHKEMHAAVLVDAHGHEQGRWQGENSLSGWHALVDWGYSHTTSVVWGIEGTGQYGRGLAQLLVASGQTVYEVNPRLTAAQRRVSRTRGKSDATDALAIARVVQQEPSLPVVQSVDATAVLAVQVAARAALVGDCTALRNRLHQHLAHLRVYRATPWPKLTSRTGVTALTDLQLPDADALAQAHAQQVRLLTQQMLLVMAQIDELTRSIETLSTGWTAPLQAVIGVGRLSAGMLAAHLGGKTFETDAALAMYAGVAPLDASSGRQLRHRLNRSGNRALNAMLHRIALSQSRHSPEARAYLAKQRAAGKTAKEAMRCLKRMLARLILTAWRQCQPPPLAHISLPLT